MKERTPCSALVGRDCKNGFPTTAVCHGISADVVLPMCCNEEACGRIYEYNGGRPGTLAERSGGIKPPEKAGAAPKRQHITDGTPCWCEPELSHKDPATGAEVWVHREPQ